MAIPVEVLKAAAELISMYGASFSLLGKQGDWDVDRFNFPEGTYTGFPVLYLFKDGDAKAQEVSDAKALKILSLLDVE